MKTMKEEVNGSIKLGQQKVAKIYKATCIESALVVEIDDELILGIDILASADIGSSIWGIFIALSGTKSSKKRRHLANVNSSKENSNAEIATILANSFEKSAAKLANTFLASKF